MVSVCVWRNRTCVGSGNRVFSCWSIQCTHDDNTVDREMGPQHSVKYLKVGQKGKTKGAKISDIWKTFL